MGAINTVGVSGRQDFLKRVNIERYSSIRVSILVPNLEIVDTPQTKEIGFFLQHGKFEKPFGIGELNPVWEDVTAGDVIGPVDENGDPTIETHEGVGGVWKIFKDLPGEKPFQLSGGSVFSVGYVGNRDVLRCGITLNAPLHPTEKFAFSGVCVRVLVHTGKTYERYPMYGTDGGREFAEDI
jgi:hypothetical protein